MKYSKSSIEFKKIQSIIDKKSELLFLTQAKVYSSAENGCFLFTGIEGYLAVTVDLMESVVFFSVFDRVSFTQRIQIELYSFFNEFYRQTTSDFHYFEYFSGFIGFEFASVKEAYPMYEFIKELTGESLKKIVQQSKANRLSDNNLRILIENNKKELKQMFLDYIGDCSKFTEDYFSEGLELHLPSYYEILKDLSFNNDEKRFVWNKLSPNVKKLFQQTNIRKSDFKNIEIALHIFKGIIVSFEEAARKAENKKLNNPYIREIGKIKMVLPQDYALVYAAENKRNSVSGVVTTEPGSERNKRRSVYAEKKKDMSSLSTKVVEVIKETLNETEVKESVPNVPIKIIPSVPLTSFIPIVPKLNSNLVEEGTFETEKKSNENKQSEMSKKSQEKVDNLAEVNKETTTSIPVVPNRVNLLADIRKGLQLKKAEKPDATKEEKEVKNAIPAVQLNANLTTALRETTDLKKVEDTKEEKTSIPVVPNRANLLADIRKGVQLKKVQKPDATNEEKTAIPTIPIHETKEEKTSIPVVPNRANLLADIRKGVQLKKVETPDITKEVPKESNIAGNRSDLLADIRKGVQLKKVNRDVPVETKKEVVVVDSRSDLMASIRKGVQLKKVNREEEKDKKVEVKPEKSKLSMIGINKAGEEAFKVESETTKEDKNIMSVVDSLSDAIKARREELLKNYESESEDSEWSD